MENFLYSSHKRLKRYFEDIELTARKKISTDIRKFLNPDFEQEDLKPYQKESKIKDFRINGQLYDEYFKELEKAKKRFAKELKSNENYLPNKPKILEYFIKLKDEYSDILSKISPNEEKSLDYDNPTISKDILSKEQPDEILKEISDLFEKQSIILRDLINYFYEKINENKAKQYKVEKGNKGYDKLKWNAEINKLVDFFYRQNEMEKTAKGKPYLETKKSNLVKFLCDNFVDFKGEPFKKDTVETCLKPGRSDKRPPIDKPID